MAATAIRMEAHRGQTRRGWTAKEIKMTDWRGVLGFETNYMVSSEGHIRNRSTGKLLLGERDKDGYRSVNLARGGKSLKRRVHRLVCEAFHGPCPEGHQAAHLDGNNRHDAADNLAWKTPKQNNADKVLHGTHQAGERHPRVKLTVQQVADIRASGSSSRALASEFGVNQSQIVRIKNGARWAEGIAQ